MLNKNKTILFAALIFFSNISYTSEIGERKVFADVTCKDIGTYAGFCCLGCCVYLAETYKSGVAIKEFVGAQQVVDKANKPGVIDNKDVILNKKK